MAISDKFTLKTTGRPTKYNKETIENILGLIQWGSTKEEASIRSGIHRDTLNEWENKYPDFLAAVKRAEALQVTTLVLAIRKAAINDWKAAAWLLERRWPEKFAKNRFYRVEEIEKKKYTLTPEKEKELRDVVKRFSEEDKQQNNGSESINN